MSPASQGPLRTQASLDQAASPPSCLGCSIHSFILSSRSVCLCVRHCVWRWRYREGRKGKSWPSWLKATLACALLEYFTVGLFLCIGGVMKTFTQERIHHCKPSENAALHDEGEKQHYGPKTAVTNSLLRMFPNLFYIFLCLKNKTTSVFNVLFMTCVFTLCYLVIASPGHERLSQVFIHEYVAFCYVEFPVDAPIPWA